MALADVEDVSRVRGAGCACQLERTRKGWLEGKEKDRGKRTLQLAGLLDLRLGDAKGFAVADV